jgi:hypothetical protein
VPDIVDEQPLDTDRGAGVEVEDAQRRPDSRGRRAGAELDEIAPARRQRLLPIQTTRALRRSVTAGGADASARTSPREVSISSASVMVTDWPAAARSTSPSKVTMRSIEEIRSDGMMRTGMPT